jgi:hypothetical protein
VRGHSRGRATAVLVAKCELLIRCYWLSAEFRAGFRLAPAAGDQPGTGAGAGSAAAGEGSAGRGGFPWPRHCGGGRCRHGALLCPVRLVCAVGSVEPLPTYVQMQLRRRPPVCAGHVV